MLKIFLRKRFVCGHIAEGKTKDKKTVEYTKWISSFNTLDEAWMFLNFERYRQAIYDRKTKITVEGSGRITDYFRELKNRREVECTTK